MLLKATLMETFGLHSIPKSRQISTAPSQISKYLSLGHREELVLFDTRSRNCQYPAVFLENSELLSSKNKCK